MQVTLDLAEKLPPIELDGDQFKQVFYNLLRNAYQALAGEDGSIVVRSSFNEYEIDITIEDDGSGISPELMGALFEPYRSTKQSGTGLGLLIVRRIVREHGGEIEVESEEDVGTRITLHLPRGPKAMRLLEQSDDSATIEVETT